MQIIYIYNKSVMEHILQPTWLNNSFLSKAIQSIETTCIKVEVLEWICKHAVPPGTNYMSDIYRIIVKYQVGSDVKSVNFVVKIPLESDSACKEFVEQVNGYEKEVKIYQEILPAMYKLHNYQLTARSFDCSLHNYLVLEDMKIQGYKMSNRLKQLDPAHCRQSLTTLARFHALSVGLQLMFPQIVGNVKELLADDISKREEIFNFNLRCMLKTMEDLEGCEKYVNILKNKITDYFETLNSILQNKNNHRLKVLCHGDIWSANILFKYNILGEIIDSKFVDFQLSKFSSFVIDIILFWWTSADFYTRENLKEEMFEVYRSTLNQTLKEIGSTERLTKEEFNEVMKIYAPFSLAVTSGVLPFVMADPDNFATVSNSTHEDQHQLENDKLPVPYNYCSKYYKNILPNILRQIEDFGAFM